MFIELKRSIKVIQAELELEKALEEKREAEMRVEKARINAETAGLRLKAERSEQQTFQAEISGMTSFDLPEQQEQE